MTPYESLKEHHARTKYTRGMFKGDAPCGRRRSKSEHRILAPQDNGVIVVRFQLTDIVTVTRDGTVTLQAGGWQNSPTTRKAFEWTFHRAGLGGWYLTSIKPHGVSQTAVITPKGSFVFYDGMQFNASGELLTPPAPKKAKRIDKDVSKAFQQALKDSGFKDMFPVLYATSQAPNDMKWYMDGPDELRRKLTDANEAHTWPYIIQMYKFTRRWDYDQRAWGIGVRVTERYDRETRSYIRRDYTAQDCWKMLMVECKKAMYRIEEVPTEANI